MKFILHLTRAEELFVSQTEFWRAQDHSGVPTVTAFHTDALGTQTGGGPVFSWSKGPRALAIFLLQAHTADNPSTFSLRGGRGSVARTLAEALRDKEASEGGPTWIQEMFIPSAEAKAEPLPKTLFVSNYKKRSGAVALGHDWRKADFEVRENGRAVKRSRYPELVEELMEAWPQRAPTVQASLTGAIEFLLYDEREPDGLPLSEYRHALRPEMQLQVALCLSRPVFAYIIWVSSEGQVQPLYPWSNYRWGRRGPDPPIKSLALPAADAFGNERWYPIDSEGGFETLLLMAREEILPRTYDRSLAKLLESFPATLRICNLKSRRKPYEFVCRPSATHEALTVRLGTPQPARDPLVRLKLSLMEKFGNRFSLIQGVILSNAGRLRAAS